MASPLLSTESAPASSVSSYREATPKIPRLIATLAVFIVCMIVPFIVYSQLQGILDTKSKSWFIYHPLFMSLGVVGLPLAAILQQRLFGYKSNKIHMYSMMISFALVVVGAFVIFTNKNAAREPHFTSTHGMLGLAWILLFIAQAMFGLFGLDTDNRLTFFKPDAGIANMKRFVNIRRLHTIGGRAILILGYTTVMFGYSTMFAADLTKTLPMGVGLLILSGVALYDPLMDYSIYRKTRRPGLAVERGA
jgi:hypothetical protein